MKMRRTIVLLGAGALALGLTGCSKSGDVDTTASTTAAPGTTVASSSTSAAPGTTAKATGTTQATPSGSMKPNTHATTFDDGTKVEGAMSCSYANKHLRLVLEGFAAGAKVTIDLDPVAGAKTDDGDYVLRSKTNGNTLAKGPATITSSVYDTAADGRDAQGLVFSFSARYDGSSGSGTVTGQGSCIVDGDRIGGNTAPTGSTLAMPVTDARAFTEKLIEVAMKDPRPDEDAFGAPKAWVAEGLPESALKGSALPASATSISGFTTYAGKAVPYEAYPFAVSDGTNCAYGVIYTTDTVKDPVGKALDATGACTGDAALEAFETKLIGK